MLLLTHNVFFFLKQTLVDMKTKYICNSFVKYSNIFTILPQGHVPGEQTYVLGVLLMHRILEPNIMVCHDIKP